MAVLRTVITAGHCVKEFEHEKPGEIAIYSGMFNSCLTDDQEKKPSCLFVGKPFFVLQMQEPTRKWRHPKEWVLHPDFDKEAFNYHMQKGSGF